MDDVDRFSVQSPRGGHVSFKAVYGPEEYLLVCFPVGRELAVMRFPLSPEVWNRHERAKWARVAQYLPRGFSLVRRLRAETLSEV